MDQNRSENTSNQQQNVHLHMHHVCNCQGSIYPTYYPAVGYRTTPIPPIVSYPAHPAVARPYLQHYQYTQFNVGSQYTVPISHVAASSSSVYGTNASSSAGTIDMAYTGATLKERRDREEGSGDVDRSNEPPEGYDYGHITPPANELLITEDSETATPENFVKFLERSCLTAEQIAYRNRNRPCFRNIQNLCIRTRSEILKPCTTISNIHSQGIPWATKDFIYAFVRLTNCWHILKGYWENRDGSSLGKIEKELTPEFRACYVRWEKETIELAAQLTRVFYNLDTNLNTSSGSNVYAANNLIPPQVSSVKPTSPEATKKTSPLESTVTTSTLTSTTTASANNSSSKNVRGILHLPSGSSMETVDQGNQTCAGDFCTVKEEEYDSEEERRVYMKPGSYNVPKKGPNGGSEHGGNGSSPRAIEFLETAQNVNKAREVVNERYWANLHIGTSKKASDMKILPEEAKSTEIIDVELNLSSHINVHEWLISSNFSDFGDHNRLSTHQQDLRPFYVDNTVTFDNTPQLDTENLQKPSSVTVLQRGKNGNGHQKNGSLAYVYLMSIKQGRNASCAGTEASNSQLSGSCFKQEQHSSCLYVGNKGTVNGRIEISSRSCRNKRNNEIPNKIPGSLRKNESSNNIAEKDGVLTEGGINVLESIVLDFKMNVLNVTTVENDKMNFDKIYQKLKNSSYRYVNEVVRDLKCVIKQMEKTESTDWFWKNLEYHLTESFAGYDFTEIKGELNEVVGPLKLKTSIFISDCEPFA